ncbi:MAG: hypothetical protein HPY66_0623 [Firmicutes bacterium]|nr:hypothetical protein [Bacillota bacterium]MDI6706809.1 DUF2089 domain-containing protein [Bacillota bacterium]
MNDALGKCPVCGRHLEITRLHCDHCNTTIEGSFSLCKFCKLSSEQKQFVDTFIRCRGNIKEVEKDLGISYPTVRSKLDDVIYALGHSVKTPRNEEARKSVLDMLERGEISHEEALKLLKEY